MLNTMSLRGVNYELALAASLGKAGIDVSIAANEINDNSNPNHVLAINDPTWIDESGVVVFYKQDGKYTILFGKKLAEEQKLQPKYKGEIKGKLITSVALKRAKIEDEEVEEVEKTYPREFSNTPIFRGRPNQERGERTRPR